MKQLNGKILKGGSSKLPHVILCALVSLPGTRWQPLITDQWLSHDCPQNSQGH